MCKLDLSETYFCVLLHVGTSNVLITLFIVYKNDMVDSKLE